MVRRLGLGKNNHLTYGSLALNPRYEDYLGTYNDNEKVKKCKVEYLQCLQETTTLRQSINYMFSCVKEFTKT